jgi:hypothetical protein
MLGEYNVPRAISTFNKRVEPLLVVFKKEIRDSILVSDPEDRSFFTKEQSELINGQPYEEKDQDNLEDVMEITKDERVFWDNMGVSPYHMYKNADPFMLKYVDEGDLSHLQSI